MFLKWLWKKLTHDWREDCFLFVSGLAKSKTPKIRQDLRLGYIHRFHLDYGDVKITVSYNDVRRTWELVIWCRESRSFLFYHDCLSSPPTKAINHLIAEYDLTSRLDCNLAEKKKRIALQKEQEADVLRRYLGHEKETPP